VFYHPDDYASGFRDVIAAWLVCLAVAATGFAYAEVSAASEDRAADARIAPQHTVPTALRTAICDDRKSPGETPPG
jgi:hypothetical protein